MNGDNGTRKMRAISSAAVSVALVTTVLIIALIAQFSSLAWFSSNERVTADGMSVQVLYEEICETVNYYRGTETRLEIEGEDRFNRYYFSYAESALDFKVNDTDTAPERNSFATPVSMLEYSDLSGSCQMLIELQLKNPGTYKIGVEIDTHDYLGNILSSALENKDFSISPMGLPLSSVVHFAVLESVDVDTENETFSLTDNDIIPIDETFVHFDAEGNAEYTHAFHDHENNEYTVNIGEDKKLYIFVDYYLPAVEDIVEKTQYYVDGALEADPTYDDIIIGLTNLVFSADFTYTIKEVSE